MWSSTTDRSIRGDDSSYRVSNVRKRETICFKVMARAAGSATARMPLVVTHLYVMSMDKLSRQTIRTQVFPDRESALGHRYVLLEDVIAVLLCPIIVH